MREEMRQYNPRTNDQKRPDDVMLLVLKTKEGTTNQCMQVADRSWERQGNVFYPRAPKETNSTECSTFILKHCFQISDLLKW